MFAMGMSPEDREEYERKMEEAREEAIARRQADDVLIKEFFEATPTEHLVLLRRVLHAVGRHGDIKTAIYFEGQLTAFLQFVREVCSHCGATHTEDELAEILRAGDPHDGDDPVDLGGHS